MKLGDLVLCLLAALFLPIRGGQFVGVFCQHAGQAGEDVDEIFFGADAEAATVLDDGVEDGAFLSGFFVAEEQPVFRSELGGSCVGSCVGSVLETCNF